ncbi:MarR family [Sphingobacterium spiritivorum]|nr:MarR family [Sphingobacterium spiritivorum]
MSMIPKNLLIQVIDQLDEYCAQYPEDLTYEGFASFVHVNRLSQNTVTRQVGGDYVPIMERDMPAEDIGKLLVMLYRYAKNYIKIAFAGTPLQTPEEFTYLMVLFTYDKLPQSELIRKNIMEKASGNEVIKRLMRMGMIMEAERSGDKRSKPISISPMGRKVLIDMLPKMRMVGNVVSGNLNQTERQLLIYLLAKLDHYHHDQYGHKDKQELEDYLHKDK